MFAPGFAPYSFSENIVNSKLALAFQDSGWEIHTISKVDDGPLYSNSWQEPWTPLRDSTYTVLYNHGASISRAIDLLRQGIKMQFPIAGVRWAGRAVDLAMKLHKKHRFKVVLSRAPNDIGHVPALHFSKATKVPWIANWNDPPAHLWPMPYKNEINVLHKTVSRLLVSQVLKYASLVTFPSERLCRNTIKSINDSSVTQKARPIPHIGLSGYISSPRKPEKCFRICHAGNLSRERQPNAFFEGIALFTKNMSISHPFEVLIIGASDHELIPLAENYGIAKHIKVFPGLNYLDTLTLLEQCDVLAIVEAPCDEGIFLPSKVTDYAQVGRPILAVSPLNGEVADLIGQTHSGELAACGNPASIADAIGTLYHSWQHGKLERNYPSTLLWEYFRPEEIIGRYEGMFSELGL